MHSSFLDPLLSHSISNCHHFRGQSFTWHIPVTCFFGLCVAFSFQEGEFFQNYITNENSVGRTSGRKTVGFMIVSFNSRRGGSQVSNNPTKITSGKHINIGKKEFHLLPKVVMISEGGI